MEVVRWGEGLDVRNGRAGISSPPRARFMNIEFEEVVRRSPAESLTYHPIETGLFTSEEMTGFDSLVEQGLLDRVVTTRVETVDGEDTTRVSRHYKSASKGRRRAVELVAEGLSPLAQDILIGMMNSHASCFRSAKQYALDEGVSLSESRGAYRELARAGLIVRDGTVYRRGYGAFHEVSGHLIGE